MKNKIVAGDFYKHIGGDSGIYFDGKKWLTFECLGCLYASRKINTRLSNGNMTNKQRIIYKFSTKNSDIKHDKNLHNEWLTNGKKIMRIK